MAGDIDPYQAQWNLRPKIDALRTEAASLRVQNTEHYRTKESELGILRDRLAREHYGLEQQAKSADIQVGVETKEIARIQAGLAKREAAMAEAEKRGDHAKVQEDREDIAGWKAELATHEARARQATLDAAELKEQAATVDRRRTELSFERGDLERQAGRVEGELDKIEQQADLMQQARLKYGEADMAKDDIPRRATLELEAEALVKQAGAIHVDRDVIRVVFPDLPTTTPGFDADPGPLPAGAREEVSANDSPSDDEAVAAAELSTEAVAAGDGDAEDGSSDEAVGAAGSDDVPTAGGDDSLGLDTFVDSAGGQGFETSASGELDTAPEPAAFLDGGAGSPESTDFGTEIDSAFDVDTFEAPAAAADPFAGAGFGGDAVGGEADQFATSDFAAPADDGVEFAGADSFESESFEG